MCKDLAHLPGDFGDSVFIEDSFQAWRLWVFGLFDWKLTNVTLIRRHSGRQRQTGDGGVERLGNRDEIVSRTKLNAQHYRRE